MGTPAVVPVITPDGQPGTVPQEKLQNALSQGFKQAVHLRSPEGQDGYIPQERVQDALSKGFTQPQAANPQPATSQPAPANAAANGVPSFLHKLGAFAVAPIGSHFDQYNKETAALKQRAGLAGPPTMADVDAYEKHPIISTINSGLAGLESTPADMLNPVTLATGALGKIAQGAGVAAKVASPLLKALGLGYGANGAADVARSGADILQHGVTPQNATQMASGAGTLLGGTLGVVGKQNLAAGPDMLDTARNSVADSLRTSAAKQYGEALNPTKEQTKYLAQNKVIPGLLKRGIVASSIPNLEEMAKQRAGVAGQAVDDAFDNLPEGASSATAPINSAMSIFKKQYQDQIPIDKDEFVRRAANNQPVSQTGEDQYVKTVDIDPNAVGAASKLQDLLSEYGDRISAQSLRKVRQTFDTQVARAGGYAGRNLAEGSELDAKKEFANAARTEIAKDNPDIAQLNDEYSFWSNVGKVANETNKRRVGQQGGLGAKIAQGVGTSAGATVGATVGGAPGAAAGALLGGKTGKTLSGLFGSASYRTASAVMKSRLADAIATGDQSGTLRIAQQIQGAQPIVKALPFIGAGNRGRGSANQQNGGNGKLREIGDSPF